MQRALQRENERRAALGLEALASLEDMEENELPDILLEQAAGIVSDMAELRQMQPPAMPHTG